MSQFENLIFRPELHEGFPCGFEVVLYQEQSSLGVETEQKWLLNKEHEQPSTKPWALPEQIKKKSQNLSHYIFFLMLEHTYIGYERISRATFSKFSTIAEFLNYFELEPGNKLYRE